MISKEAALAAFDKAMNEAWDKAGAMSGTQYMEDGWRDGKYGSDSLQTMQDIFIEEIEKAEKEWFCPNCYGSGYVELQGERLECSACEGTGEKKEAEDGK